MSTTASGLLLIDKPSDMTSHDVVDAVRRIAGTRAVGHAGTLDPFATGLLILGINKGTKQLTALVGASKEYIATLRLGATTDTFDREGKVTPVEQATEPSLTEIETALNRFRGGYDQLAPLFSAKKIKGKKLYDLARKGTATEDLRPMKHVEIPDLTILDYSYPLLTVRVACSSGTYIRSLADDIGRELETGAYLEELRRTKIGTYHVDVAAPLSILTAEHLEKALFTPS